MIALTERPYEEYNKILPIIKQNIQTFTRSHMKVLLFEKTLVEELPLTTARCAYRTAIRVAVGEQNVRREFVAPPEKKLKPLTPSF